jgi:hypothetical protein
LTTGRQRGTVVVDSERQSHCQELDQSEGSGLT